jgi:hypothetical protein
MQSIADLIMWALSGGFARFAGFAVILMLIVCAIGVLQPFNGMFRRGED